MPTRAVNQLPSQTTVAYVARWTGLLAGDDGERLACPQYTDKSVQISGVFGGATLRIEGSNDGTNWSTLTDPQGNDLLFTGAKIEMVSEATLFIRPFVVGGDGTTALAVHMLVKE